MAINRLVALWVVAFAATTFPMEVSSGFFNSGTRNKHLVELGQKFAQPSEAETILERIDKPKDVYIGQLDVKTVLKLAKEAIKERKSDSYHEPSQEDCAYDEVSRRVSSILDSNPIVFLNVFELIYPNLVFCPLNINQIYRDNLRLVGLRKEGLDTGEIENILESIENKLYVRVGKLNVDTILDRAKETGLKIDEDCRYDALDSRNLFRMDTDLNSILNVYRFVNQKSKREIPECSDIIKKLFEENKKLDPLRDDILDPVTKIRQILDSIGDKENVYIGGSNVKTIIEQASMTSFSLTDCTNDDLVRRKYADDDSETLLLNIEKFDTTRRKLLNFCADSLGNVFRIMMLGIPSESENTIINFYKEISGDHEIVTMKPSASSNIKASCSLFMKSYAILKYIWSKSAEAKKLYSHYIGVMTEKEQKMRIGCEYYHQKVATLVDYELSEKFVRKL